MFGLILLIVQHSQQLFASVTRVHHNESRCGVALTLSDDGGAVKHCAGFSVRNCIMAIAQRSTLHINLVLFFPQ